MVHHSGLEPDDSRPESCGFARLASTLRLVRFSPRRRPANQLGQLLQARLGALLARRGGTVLGEVEQVESRTRRLQPRRQPAPSR